MRMHTRDKGRYFRTEAGELTLDWGFDGADYTTLEFSYAAKFPSGNMRSIKGQVKRNEDGETYDTYAVQAGTKRLKCVKKGSIAAALRAHVKEVAGCDLTGVDVMQKMPKPPKSVREELYSKIQKAVEGWDFFWGLGRAENKDPFTDEEKESIRKTFVSEIWEKNNFWCDTMADKVCVVAVGLLNLNVGQYGTIYRAWREWVRTAKPNSKKEG